MALFANHSLPKKIIGKNEQIEKNSAGEDKKYCVDYKASYRWIEHLHSCHSMLATVGKEIIHVTDRESNINEFLQTAQDINAKYRIKIRIANIYRQRWSIETYHRALKSGYGIEEARLGSRAD